MNHTALQTSNLAFQTHITRNLSNQYTPEITIVTITRVRYIQGDSGGKDNILGSESIGPRGGAVGLGAALQVGRSRVRFPIMSLGYFMDVILTAALRGRLSL